ncbi:hypothetical protein [Desmospora activa]|uniref:Uncharacterized protein n=1 Tax=Desmospora activa DSM 45169 TaxID=1121389 RepID=A0A2T4Z805_9BACL|nr:hypothetical protein [Desmospora activa]PTM58032.1 hypothetical protein C8J48_0604 [Desmospora activa DSM 45169]
MSQFRWIDRNEAIERVATYVRRGFNLTDSIDRMLEEGRYSNGEGISELQRKRLEADVQRFLEEQQEVQEQKQEKEEYVPAWIRLRR